MRLFTIFVASGLVILCCTNWFIQPVQAGKGRRLLTAAALSLLGRGKKMIIPLPLPIPIPYPVKDTKHEIIHKGMEAFPIPVGGHGHTNIHIGHGYGGGGYQHVGNDMHVGDGGYGGGHEGGGGGDDYGHGGGGGGGGGGGY